MITVILITMLQFLVFFFFNDTATTEIYTLSLHDALPILSARCLVLEPKALNDPRCPALRGHRTDRHHRGATRSRGQGVEGVGHRASLCRFGRSRRDLWTGLGRAAPA